LLIFLPIDSNSLILFYDDEFYEVGIAGKQVFEIKDVKVVNDINLLHFLNCEDSIFFSDEAEEDYIRSLFERSRKFERANQVVLTEHPVVDSAGRIKKYESILHSRTTCCRTGLNIPFIKLTKKAKKFEPKDKMVHTRPFVEEMMKGGLLEKLRKARFGNDDK
jgi:hypothetical protein